jgi:hypothetical protein
MPERVIDEVLADPRIQALLWLVPALIVFSVVDRILFRGSKRHTYAELPSDPPGIKRAVRVFWVARTAFVAIMAGAFLAARFTETSVDTAMLLSGIGALAFLAVSTWMYFSYRLVVSSVRRAQYMIVSLTGWKLGLYLIYLLAGFALLIVVINWVLTQGDRL